MQNLLKYGNFDFYWYSLRPKMIVCDPKFGEIKAHWPLTK